jgi:hypothetical protein
MTDEQKTKFVALQDAWLAVLERYRRAESVPERDVPERWTKKPRHSCRGLVRKKACLLG